MSGNNSMRVEIRNVAFAALLCGLRPLSAQPGPPDGLGGNVQGAPSGLAQESALQAIETSLFPPPLANLPSPSADARNFEGNWASDASVFQEFEIRSDLYGNKIPFNQSGRKVMDRRLAATDAGTPFLNASARCRPPGPPWQRIISQFRVFQSHRRVDFFFSVYHGRWSVFLDPAAAPPAAKEYMGRSMAHWDGDTLVVETSDFKDGLWLDLHGTPVSANAKLIQRIRKVREDRWFLEIVTTVDDPKYYRRPWSWVRTYSWRPDLSLLQEFNCEDQAGDKNNTATMGGLIPEPED